MYKLDIAMLSKFPKFIPFLFWQKISTLNPIYFQRLKANTNHIVDINYSQPYPTISILIDRIKLLKQKPDT